MDCRSRRLVTPKANGPIVRDGSSGYGMVLDDVDTGLFDAPVYAHARRSFAEGRPPWPGICETCHTFRLVVRRRTRLAPDTPDGRTDTGLRTGLPALHVQARGADPCGGGFSFELPMTDRAPIDRLGFRVHAGHRQHEF